MRTSDIVPTRQSTILYGGKVYIKMLLLKSNVEVLDQTVRRKCSMWLCIEDAVALPTRTVVVPEVLR
jgi:hypothetical protein